MTRDYVTTKCITLGVEFRNHKDSTLMRIAGWYHYMRGNPLFRYSVYVTMAPTVFVPDSIGDPLDEDWQIVDHELVHWESQMDMGLARWVSKYLTSWRFREQEEKPAFLRDIKNGRLDVEQVVKRLRGPLYGVQTPAEELREWFERQLAVRVPRRPSDGV